MIRLVLFLALLIPLAASAGTFIRNGEIKFIFVGIEGASAWGTPVTDTYNASSCLGIAFADRPEGTGVYTCSDTGNNRDAFRLPLDAYIIEAVWVTQLTTNTSDDCMFQFAIVDGITMVGDEYDARSHVSGDKVVQPIGISLAAGEPMFLNVRELVDDGNCGSSLGKQNLFIRYIE